MIKPPKRGNQHLSNEDAVLWNFVTRSVTRLHGAKTETQDLPPTNAQPKGSRQVANRPKDAPDKPSRPARPLPSYTPPPQTRFANAAEQQVYDHREARKISRGQTPIDARIDLHGLRQADAHLRLIAFLRTAASNGHRHVLVITGKGRDTDDRATSYADTLERSPRGILRRNVPMWLEEPDLRGIVLSYREAADHHGGAGALYVRLRTRHR